MTSAKPTHMSAAEISKGVLKVMSIGENDVARLLDPCALLDGLADGFRCLARGEIQTPNRPEITVPDTGFLLSMPAWRPGGPIMVKMVSVFEGNLELGLPNHVALITLYDPQTGVPVCIMDGTHITGMRTAGAAVLSVREIARHDARVATIVGAGVQAREHLALLPLVRDFDEIGVFSLYREDAETLAATAENATAVVDLEAAVRRSDVVCLASHAYAPVIDARWVQPGTHVSSVGYAPPAGELPIALASDHTLFVEDAAAFEPPPTGCGELQEINPRGAITLGEALLNISPRRSSDEEITVYKAMGIAMEDLVAADLVYRAALEDGYKKWVEL